MKLLALSLILVGLVWLALSLKPTRKILNSTQKSGWKFLLFLIGCFLVAYIEAFIFIFSSEEFISAYLGLGFLLVGGAAFVFVVTHYSLNSLMDQEYQASHDRLTNLKNRHSFNKSIALMTQNEKPFYIMLIDLNDFKHFNDAFGYPFGDELLKKIAQYLSTSLPTDCLLFRVGADEFAVLGNKHQANDITNDVNALLEPFEQPIAIGNQYLRVGASIGVTVFPNFGNDIDELIQQAEQALDASKTGRNQWRMYSEELNRNAAEHLAIANKLQRALDNHEFELYYQPLINAADHSLHGAEVLIRWQQKNGSFIPPDLFIPIAEQSTLIHDITCWVIDQAINDLQILDQNGFSGNLHINLSVKDLHSQSLLTCLDETIIKQTSAPHRITLEVTESAMMTDIKTATQNMAQLSELGFAFSLDDFGTGFSSFPLLRDLPLNQIKIDRSFVKDMATNEANHSIVKSMLYLAKSLNCSAVAEGVEDRHTADMLNTMKCDYLQGYCFSKPLPLSEFQLWYDATKQDKS
ncbi:bifunctional diguanylate cyclase/phosphodiesterase [Vibrio hannami]|uniref:putative bifunctional diguanylate cyclase/phosphodiesterase n=1 Tax=Vibrio hannami TaxID=2717094 RepID=UPI002410AF36|nr:bifunctional diguanylate cyclase/phosphodiesterase [Vibrio hannami]MDG3085707.1 bifunctional diguanylate cyclase/phosphodiesterase [Vibrio hannami]